MKCLNVPVDGPGLVGGELGDPVEASQLRVLHSGPLLPSHLNLDYTNENWKEGETGQAPCINSISFNVRNSFSLLPIPPSLDRSEPNYRGLELLISHQKLKSYRSKSRELDSYTCDN